MKTLFEILNVEQCKGKKLIDIEYIYEKDKTGSGACEEIILHFENGKELLIYVHDNGKIIIEGD